jgi:hypothetical protein
MKCCEYDLRKLQMAQKARVLHNPGLERLYRDKDSSLLGPFLSYEEYEVL